jgi:UDP-N-acetyl-D-glucosamine dehydrogenase
MSEASIQARGVRDQSLQDLFLAGRRQITGSELEKRLSSRDATVGVVGLGYVGLPLALTMAEAGKRAVGFDVDRAKVDKLRAGESYIRHIAPERIRRRLSAAHNAAEHSNNGGPGFFPTTDFSVLVNCDAIVICVPTPLSEGREPDLGYVSGTAETVAKYLRRGQLVVLESTTYPGTTDELVRPILERGGLRVGEDFHLAFSPEREDPGNPDYTTRTIPKLVGGVTGKCGEVAAALYRSFLREVVVVSSARVAEAAKLLENIYRSVNIALVNELKMLFERMGIDVWEVIGAAATKPFGFTPFYPGPGLGGHCIPIDPFYLTWKARHYDFSTRFIELAGEVNTGMPYWVVERAVEALSERGRAIKGAKVLVLGVAYKKDVDDLRESPSLKVIEILESRGAQVSYNDPYVPSLRARKLRHYETFELDSVELSAGVVSAADCVLIATDHGAYDYDWIVRHARLVIDTRNATRHVAHHRDKILRV